MRIFRIVVAAPVMAALLAAAPVVAEAGGKKHCPPGLAKKGSCIPPGNRKAWKAGYPLAHEVYYRRIVDYGHYHLPPPPHGHIYAEVGGDILLMLEATRHVVEAVILIDALSR